MEANMEVVNSLIQAVNALKQQIKDIKEEVNTLKADKEHLEQENAQLKQQLQLLASKTKNPTMSQVFTAPLENKSNKLQAQINDLNRVIQAKDNYIRKLELSLAKYNYTEVELLQKFKK